MDTVYKILLDTQERTVIEGCLIKDVVEELNTYLNNTYVQLRDTVTESYFSPTCSDAQLNSIIRLYMNDLLQRFPKKRNATRQSSDFTGYLQKVFED